MKQYIMGLITGASLIVCAFTPKGAAAVNAQRADLDSKDPPPSPHIASRNFRALNRDHPESGRLGM